MKKTILLSCIFVFSLLFQAFLSQEVRADVVVLEATYSIDVSSGGIKYYHDGNDWVGRGNSGILRSVNRWNIASIDPSWDILSVEVRFYTESKTGSPGTLSLTRYGSSHGEDNPESDTGTLAYSKIAGTPYASLPEPSSGSWTNWINLGSMAASDIAWCRDGGLSAWSLGLKASDAIEASTTVRHVDFSEDNETNDAELRITYTPSSSSNTSPTAVIDSITPNPATTGQSVTFTGHGVDTDGTVTAYEWISSISGILSTASSFSTSSLSAGTHTISFRVRDDDGAWSSPVTTGLTVTGGSTQYQLTLEAAYSTDVNSSGTKYYHDGNDWVGRANSGPIRAVNRWNIASIDPSWDIVSVEVRFYTESKTGSPGTLSLTRYGTSHGEDNPESDTGTLAYTKINNTPYASLPEPSSGSWTNWINLGSMAASDIAWCRDGGLSIWSLGLKASDAIETSTTVRHADFSEDNEANDAELRITYTVSSSSNTPPTATIDSITPNPATTGQSVTFTGHGVDTDGTVTAYEWISSISGILSTASSFSTSSLSAGTHTISFRVRDDDGAWSSPVTTGLTVTGGSTQYQLTLEAAYSTDVNSSGTKYYHDGNDWVGRANSGPIRAVNRWNIASIDPSWDIVSVEVRFYTESKTGSPGTLSLTRYGTSHGEDNPETDAGTLAYTKINNTPYASLPEPSSGSWTNWINLGSMAASDIAWCRDGGLSIWSLGLKASDAIETSTTVRHADFSEDNEANDAELRITYTVSSSSTLPFSDDFNRTDLGDDWSIYDDDGSTKVPNWQIINGELHQTKRVESTSSFDGTYHKGTYAYLTSRTALTDYRFTVEATYLNDEYGYADDIGIMFRYQDNNNYYRLTLNSRYGFTRLEKKVNGTFSTLAKNARGFQKGAKLGIMVDVKGSIIQVFLDNDPLFGVSDGSIGHGSIALYCQDAAKFDNVLLEESSRQPSIVLSKPTAHSLEVGSTLNVEAVTTNVPSGGYVEFLLDGTSSIVITQPPYSAQYYNVSEGIPHSVKAVLHGSSSELAVDVNSGVYVLGDYYIAIGDSITNGEGDSYTSDNILQDGTIISFQGYEAPLTYNLNLSTSYPNIVFNEGIGGDKSQNAAYVRINSILERHPGANRALIMLGTNDSSGSLPVPSGLGCSGTSCSGTFKGNMQALVNTLISRQITPFVARIPPTFVPSPAFRNSMIQQYNQVILELSGIQVGPDFYSFFTNSPDFFADELHPNGLGHKAFAQLWYNVLLNQNVVPFVLDNLSPATYKQNLLEVGNNYYIDANYAISSIPSALTEGDVVWIMTADSDRNNTSTNSLSFQINANSTVYIGYDPRALSLPSWLANNFTPVGTVIGVTDPDVSTLNLYQADFAVGTVSLGGNKASGASFPNGIEAANYVVIVKKGVN